MNLTLKHFVLKFEVLNMYRYVIRASRSLPEPARWETITWIRSEFERNKHLTDVAEIEDKLNSSRRELRQILPMGVTMMKSPSRRPS